MLAWKIYFWTFVIYSLIGLLGIFLVIGSLGVGAAVISILFQLILVFAAYSYIFKKNGLLPKNKWKLLFIFIVLVELIYLINSLVPSLNLGSFIFFLNTKLNTNTFEIIVSLLLDLPAMYCLYRLQKSK